MKTSKSLVTGGAGFIGSHLVNELIGKGHEVVVLDDLSGGYEQNVNPKAVFIKGSIVDSELIDKIFQDHNFDYVYHLAAYAAEGLSHFIKRFNYTNNLIGSVNLINASIKHGIKCFVFTSSIAVYGAGQLPLRESQTPIPEDPYGIAKLAVEQELRVSKEMFGLDYVIFRPHNVYGEFQNIGDRYRNVVGIFMNQLMQDKELSVFGDGLQTRAFSYIGDIIPHIASCVDNPKALNEVFNIGAEQEYSVIELAQTIMKVMGKDGNVRHLPPRNEVQHAWSDHTKAKSVFNITHHTPLMDGLQKMAKWVKETGIRKTSIFSDIELTKNFPTFWLEN